MDVSTKCKDRSLEVYLKGELDHHGAKGFLKEIEQYIERDMPLRLTLDFTGITFMDSSGIAVVLRTWQCMRELDGEVVLRNVAPQPKKVFEAVNINRMVTME